MVTATRTSGDGQTITVGSPADEPFQVTLIDEARKPVVGRRYKFVIKAEVGKKDLIDALTNERGEAQMVYTPDAPGPFKVHLFVEGQKSKEPTATFTGNALKEDDIHLEETPDMPEPPMAKPAAAKPPPTPPPLPYDADGPAAGFFQPVFTPSPLAEEELSSRLNDTNVVQFPVVRPPPAPRFEVGYGLLVALIAASALAATIAALLT